MNRQLSLIAFVMATLLPTATEAQEIAGRVVVAAGEVLIVRGQQRITARVGTEVRAGDTLELGTQSNAQVLLTDQSIVALRPETTFRLSEYVFANRAPEEQRLFFDLVKGGLRTLTGVIGKLRPDNYRVNTVNAVIGIRGTNYGLVLCDNNCRNSNGTLAPNGTYGAVSEGRISVTNQAGESVFGVDQYFRVSSQTARPEKLLAPPSFLRDTLEGRARARQAQTAQAQQAGSQQRQAAAPAEDARVSSAASQAAVLHAISAHIIQSTANASTQGPAAIVQATNTGTFFYRATAPLSVPITSCSNPPCGTVTLGDVTLGVNLALQRAGLRANLLGADGAAYNIGTPTAAGNDGMPITISGGQVTFNAYYALADYPLNRGAFRCEACGPGHTPGFITSFGVDGAIHGAQASLLLYGDDGSGKVAFSLDLTRETLPNNVAAAIVVPRQAGGANTRSAGYWDVQLGSAGELLRFGPSVGGPRAAVGATTNTVIGSAPDAGSLVWGQWQGPGAQLTDDDYKSFTTSSGSVPWITGQPTNTLPPSLGSVTYKPVGGFVNGGGGALNSGSLTADFVNRSLSISLNASNLRAGNTFQMNGSTGFSVISGRFGSGFNSVTCTGPCVGGTAAGSFSGFFAGPKAEGAGVAFTAGFGLGTGVSGAAAFKR